MVIIVFFKTAVYAYIGAKYSWNKAEDKCKSYGDNVHLVSIQVYIFLITKMNYDDTPPLKFPILKISSKSNKHQKCNLQFVRTALESLHAIIYYMQNFHFYTLKSCNSGQGQFKGFYKKKFGLE